MKSHQTKRRWRFVLSGLAIAYLLLMWPEGEPPQLPGAGKQPFAWSRDQLWRDLESQLRVARDLSPPELAARFAAELGEVEAAIAECASTNLLPQAVALDDLETKFFRLAVAAAVSPERGADFLRMAGRYRELASTLAQQWPRSESAAAERIYRMLYGRRAAVEEVLLQWPPTYESLDRVADSAQTNSVPSVRWRDVLLQSGDILVSRGGAATSALIARGNDFRGNFSHVALVHVDEQSREISVIESRIETGVIVRSIEAYFSDIKLRVMVLRLRADHPAVVTNASLPHFAAAVARSNVLAAHIPYDFAMDHRDPSQQFCSEVVSSAYGALGVKLWTQASHLSAPGLVRWLTLLGVRNFESQQPTDLEYDPQLRVVAEWRNPETLFRDHVDNAVIDAMLEQAEQGAALDYNRWLLPPFRLVKAWSMVLNAAGRVGPVPEGMSATTALRVERFKARHAAARDRVLAAADEFQRTNHYSPPQWELLRMARVALK